MSNKALLFIFFILLLSVAVVFLIFYFYQKSSSNEEKFTATPPLEEENKQNNKNIVYASSIEQLVLENVVSPTTNSKNDKILYIDQQTSGIYEFDPNLKTKEKIGSPHQGNIASATWSLDKTKVVLQYENQEKFVYDLKTNQEFPLNKNVQNVIFGKNSDEIFYQFSEEGNKNKINKAHYTGQNWKNLTDYPLKNIVLGLVPNSKLIYFCPPASGFQKTACYAITESGQDLKTLTQEEYGQSIKYRGDGAKILYTSAAKKGLELNLNIMDNDATHKKYLQINTLVEKCVFGDGNKIYCAVPELIPTDSVMPDDYYNHKFVTNDIFWEIDSEKITKTRLTEIKDFKWGNNDAINPFFLKDGKDLFFFSGNGLYVLHLSLTQT